ncbi:hypothetical protein KIN20_023302 [Parelaphostrongylus tenuis]|uniref:Uncharacterized protein n=1 Tax=Parelaphostrongylus tenuis TaxID=148309 RepID=A0AAD5QVY4_PARTN|nr:hypothetical protein KIN20_023302 [Parelaphostrongylus tenuis]
MVGEVEHLTASAKSAETAQELLEEVKPLTSLVKSVETGQEIAGEEAESLTACRLSLITNYEYLLLVPDKYCYEHNSRIVVSNNGIETAVLDYIYSEYSLPPSDTNVEIDRTFFKYSFSVSFYLELSF